MGDKTFPWAAFTTYSETFFGGGYVLCGDIQPLWQSGSDLRTFGPYCTTDEEKQSENRPMYHRLTELYPIQ